MDRLPELLRESIASYIEKYYAAPLELSVPDSCFEDISIGSFCEDASWGKEIAPPKQCAVYMEEPASLSLSLEEVLRQEDAGFTETLLRRIDDSGKKDSEIYKKAGLSKQHFSKIRSNPRYKPTKATAIALALALELSLEETQDLIGRAGYVLTNASKFDLIVRYFIEHKKYNITELNIALYEFDQPLLGV